MPSVLFSMITILFILGSSVLAKDGLASPKIELTILTIENAPYSYTNADGELAGLGYDILIKALDRSKTQAKFIRIDDTKVPFQRILKRVRDNDNHCFFIMNRTPLREDKFKWVSPLLMGGWALFKRAGDDAITINNFEDLHKYIITGLRRNAPVVALEKEGLKLAKVDDYDHAFKLISVKRADLIIGGKIDMASRTAKPNTPGLEMAYYWRKSYLGMGCSLNTDQATLDKLNEALTAIRD